MLHFLPPLRWEKRELVSAGHLGDQTKCLCWHWAVSATDIIHRVNLSTLMPETGLQGQKPIKPGPYPIHPSGGNGGITKDSSCPWTPGSGLNQGKGAQDQIGLAFQCPKCRRRLLLILVTDIDPQLLKAVFQSHQRAGREPHRVDENQSWSLTML